MPKTILLFLITGGFLVSNLVCQAKQYKGLKVHGDYKSLTPLAEKVAKNKAGITEEHLLRVAKLKLMKEGIKPQRSDSPYHYLWIELNDCGQGNIFQSGIIPAEICQGLWI